jgi:hypothetical protein
MAFTQFKSIGEVVKKYQLSIRKEDFVKTTPIHKAPEVLQEEIQLSLRQGLYKHSEAAICEQLIHPVLRSLWVKSFLEELLLWSHTTFYVTDVLSGTPDYLFAQRTRQFDTEALEAPILVAVEAKKDNFQEGWGQCVAEMVAAQMANENPQLTIYGVVTNGKDWEFGKLQDKILTKNYNYLDIFDLDKLYSALYYILEDCKNQFISVNA